MSPPSRTPTPTRSRAQSAKRPASRSSGRTGSRTSSSPARVTPLRRRGSIDLTEPYAEDPLPKGRRVKTVKTRKPPGRRSKSFLTLLSLVFVLNLVGLAMVLSASSVMSLQENGSPWYQFLRQFLWFGIGLVAMVFTLRIDYHRWQRFAKPLVYLSLVMLVLVLVPHVGMKANGATRWLGYGAFSIQPSEFAKLAVVLFTAELLSRRAHRIEDTALSLRPVIVVFLAFAALIMLQPNLGTTMIIFASMFIMLFVAGIPGWSLAKLLGAAAAAGFFFMKLFPWRARRLSAFADPWTDPQGVGYQPIESATAISNGGIVGTGLGQGRAKWGFLPEAHTDFIYSVIAEETGWIGALLVIALFVTFGVVGIRVAMRAPDRFGMLLATGITSWFLIQAFLNLGAAVVVLPITGVPLPFVSSGGSSLVVSMVAAGMLLNVARQTR